MTDCIVKNNKTNQAWNIRELRFPLSIFEKVSISIFGIDDAEALESAREEMRFFNVFASDVAEEIKKTLVRLVAQRDEDPSVLEFYF